MDPTQALIEALQCIGTIARAADSARAAVLAMEARYNACERLRDLADWLERDGFAPDVQAAVLAVAEPSE